MENKNGLFNLSMELLLAFGAPVNEEKIRAAKMTEKKDTLQALSAESDYFEKHAVCDTVFYSSSTQSTMI